jgi:TolA-binding protein
LLSLELRETDCRYIIQAGKSSIPLQSGTPRKRFGEHGNAGHSFARPSLESFLIDRTVNGPAALTSTPNMSAQRIPISTQRQILSLKDQIFNLKQKLVKMKERYEKQIAKLQQQLKQRKRLVITEDERQKLIARHEAAIAANARSR